MTWLTFLVSIPAGVFGATLAEWLIGRFVTGHSPRDRPIDEA